MAANSAIEWTHHTFQSLVRMHQSQRRLRQLLRRGQLLGEDARSEMGAARQPDREVRERVAGAGEVESGGAATRSCFQRLDEFADPTLHSRHRQQIPLADATRASRSR